LARSHHKENKFKNTGKKGKHSAKKKEFTKKRTKAPLRKEKIRTEKAGEEEEVSCTVIRETTQTIK
jgi:hypothetical protein